MTLAIADRWFDVERIDDDITLITEPYVTPLIRCNIWHLRGSVSDMVVDSGLGIASLRQAAAQLFEKPVIAVASHTHYDHTGGFHEFEERLVHPEEADELANPVGFAALVAEQLDDGLVEAVEGAGIPIPACMIDALPGPGYDPAAYRVQPAPATRLVEEGDIVDTGSRRFEVLHLPGHSPGSIGLWEAETGVLFSGDAIYDGPLLDNIPGADVEHYIRTMERLSELPVTVVHAGHDPSFGRERLHELANDYLRSKE
jgi:glyoxylase-like metal-dependent hydrolase (beta-lactamase superfamily II)